MSISVRLLGCLVCMVAGTVPFATTRGQEGVDFQRDILPLLSDRCFTCHGPDAGTREAGLRLDQQDPLLLHVSPGEPDHSELWARIESGEMPPPESGLTLNEEERQRIRNWISQGAPWNRHWSLVPLPETVPVPDSGDSGWPRSDLDRFVLDRLNREGLRPAPEAPRWRWLRRVSLDLTGLPPTPEEIAAFENDNSAGARERVVERLLASPRFGQHMAISWLDAARYADSYGYQSDLLSPTWPWRDWLVRALNDNLPYDEFLTWQLAGDLLPEPGRDQILATAFNRLHRMTNEGGSLEAEWRVENTMDRVNTLGTAVLGMTLECARCHDHKYDPISQQDYYNLYAYFNSIDEWGVYHDSERVPTPSLLLPDAAQQSAIDAAQAAWDASRRDLDGLIDQYRSGLEPAGTVRLEIEPFAWFRLDDMENDEWLENSVVTDQIGNTGPANRIVEGRVDKAILLDGDEVCEFPYVGTSLQPWDPFAVSFWMWLPTGTDKALIMHQTGGTDCGFFGTELVMESGKLRLAMMRFWPGNAIAITTRTAVPRDQWVHVVASSDGSGKASGLDLLVNGQRDWEVYRDNLTKRPDAPDEGFFMGARLRSTGMTHGKLDDVQVFERPLTRIESRLIMSGRDHAPTSEFAGELVREHQVMTDFRVVYLQQILAEKCKQLLDARTDVVEIPVMRETSRRHDAWVLSGGQYDAPRTDDNRAERNVPAALPAIPADWPDNRLGLARWLTTADHPLTARVAVNRLWRNFWETGLCQTMNDFGLQGRQPEHPELLDWLARDFVEHGWDVKRFCRQIVLSSAYRQASQVPLAQRAGDPRNRLLARGPSRRLTAEMIRDQALFAAGLLDEQAEGPPVSPYQPDGLWSEGNSMSPEYVQSVGTDLYRRSLYTVWKRTAPLPNMALFDVTGREVCTVDRMTTNTPLQAMVLLNDPQFVEAARVLAERTMQQHPDDPDKMIEQMFVLLTGRQPDAFESDLLRETFAEQLPRFEEHPDEAARLLAVGERSGTAGLPPARVAAATAVAQTIMNSDASVWSR